MEKKGIICYLKQEPLATSHCIFKVWNETNMFLNVKCIENVIMYFIQEEFFFMIFVFSQEHNVALKGWESGGGVYFSYSKAYSLFLSMNNYNFHEICLRLLFKYPIISFQNWFWLVCHGWHDTFRNKRDKRKL